MWVEGWAEANSADASLKTKLSTGLATLVQKCKNVMTQQFQLRSDMTRSWATVAAALQRRGHVTASDASRKYPTLQRRSIAAPGSIWSAADCQ
jgi:hypothetical protein